MKTLPDCIEVLRYTGRTDAGLYQIADAAYCALGLLKAAKCPDPACDGEGTCSGTRPGYDGEPDLDVWQCQWCEIRDRLVSDDGS